jgi:hypothetical protein
MKRNVLMITLLVAGLIAFVQLTMLVQAMTFLLGMWRPGSGIGSVSAGYSESLVETVPMFFPSFLLWRVCANLSAGGDPVMERHRRFHARMLLAGLVLLIAIVGSLIILATTGDRLLPPTPLGWLMIAVMMLFSLPVAFVLTSSQLYSSFVAFRALLRDNRLAS